VSKVKHVSANPIYLYNRAIKQHQQSPYTPDLPNNPHKAKNSLVKPQI